MRESASVLSLVSLVLFQLASVGEQSEHEALVQHWTYENQDSWQCDATNLRQSPIDIDTSNVVYRPDWRLNFLNYDQPVEFQIRNTHHSVSLLPLAAGATPSIEVNWVPGGNEFELKEVHFHWGDGINKGSEHEINDQKAAAEMHMVHYKKGLSSAEIGSVENSIVVIGVLIETDKSEHNTLESLVAATSKVNGTDEEYMSDQPQDLINLLPTIHDSFFTYNGSLTTPPCYEVVTWVLMSQPVYLSQDRLRELSNFARVGASNVMENIGPNFREIQPLLDRPVYSSFDLSVAVPVLQNTTPRTSGFRLAFEKYMPDIRARIKSTFNRAVAAAKSARQRMTFRGRSSSVSSEEPSTDSEES